jgi:pimeloyl-ACP methyl ester carboxylesterase
MPYKTKLIFIFALILAANAPASRFATASEIDVLHSKEAKVQALGSFLHCITANLKAICSTLNGDLLLATDRDLDTGNFHEVQLLHQGKRYRALDFQCKMYNQFYCLVRGETLGGLDSAVFKMNIMTAEVKVLISGRYEFGPMSTEYLTIVNTTGPKPTFYSINYITDDLEQRWTSETYGLLEGFVPIETAGNSEFAFSRYSLDAANRRATIFLRQSSELVASYSDLSSLLFGMWSSASPGSGYLWATGNDFPRGLPTAALPAILQAKVAASNENPVSWRLWNSSIALPNDIIMSKPPQVDRFGDVFVVTGTESGPSVKVICRDNYDAITLKELTVPNISERITLFASPLIEGVTIRREAPGKQWTFQHLSLTTAKVHGHRLCSETVASFGKEISAQTHLPVSHANGVRNIVLKLGSNDSNSNAPTAALVISKSNVTTPTQIIVDLYGAVGGTPQAPSPYLEPFDTETNSNWVAQAILPGDGDLGRRFAISSATPNRLLTVSTLNFLSEKLVDAYPSLRGNITLRAGSAGASSAILAALGRPDLYSGAILFSGAYDWVALGETKEMSGFHSPIDQIEIARAIFRTPENCFGLKFLLFHATDDSRAIFSQANDFASQLAAKKCLIGRAFFGSGGHELSLTKMRSDDAASFLSLVQERGSRPLIKNLGLARSRGETPQ